MPGKPEDGPAWLPGGTGPGAAVPPGEELAPARTAAAGPRGWACLQPGRAQPEKNPAGRAGRVRKHQKKPMSRHNLGPGRQWRWSRVWCWLSSATRGAPLAPARCPEILAEVRDPSPHRQLRQNIPRDTHALQRDAAWECGEARGRRDRQDEKCSPIPAQRGRGTARCPPSPTHPRVPALTPSQPLLCTPVSVPRTAGRSCKFCSLLLYKNNFNIFSTKENEKFH